jgi:hypothetical protein
VVRCLFGFSVTPQNKTLVLPHSVASLHLPCSSSYSSATCSISPTAFKMESQELVTVIRPPPPPPVDAETAIKEWLDGRMRGLREMLDNPFWSIMHSNFKTLLELYENGTLSPTQHKTVYIQDGVVYNSPPAPRYDHPTWTEVSSYIYIRHDTRV